MIGFVHLGTKQEYNYNTNFHEIHLAGPCIITHYTESVNLSA